MGKAGRDLPGLLQDLGTWGAEAESFVAGRTADWLLEDRTAELALTRMIEVVGEISARILRLHPEWCRTHEIEELTMAYRMRNRLAHGYEDIRADLLFDVANRHIPELNLKAREWLRELVPDERP